MGTISAKELHGCTSSAAVAQQKQVRMRVPCFFIVLFMTLATVRSPSDAQGVDVRGEQEQLPSSDEPAFRSLGEILLDDLSIAVRDGGSFFSSPLRFSGNDWLVAGCFVGGTVGLFALDAEAQKWIGRETISSLNNDFWDIPTRYGTVTYANAFGVATYATGLLIGNDDIRITGRLLLESLSFSGLSVISVRFVAGRSRPYSGDGPWKFNGFTLDNEIQSFPSGHTTVAFGMSTILAERIDTWWSRVFFYGMASLTAYARVLNNQHWLSDVVVGGAFGLGAGLFVIQREKERGNHLTPSGAHFFIQPSLKGIRVTYVF